MQSSASIRRRAPGCPTTRSRSAPTPNARRIIAYGFRNPFRLTVRPGTSEVWSGDVGWNTWEELNRVESVADGAADNYGWPCYEGGARQSGYDSANLSICENLYAQGGVVAPHYAYNHSATVVAGRDMPDGKLVRRRRRVRDRHELPRRLRRRVRVRRLQPQVHLDHARGHRRSSRPVDAPNARSCRQRPGRRHVRARRRALLRGLRRRHDPTYRRDRHDLPRRFRSPSRRRGRRCRGRSPWRPTRATTSRSRGSSSGSTAPTSAAEDTSSPYQLTWDTTHASNGQHTLTAIARDSAGNLTTSTTDHRHRLEPGAAAGRRAGRRVRAQRGLGHGGQRPVGSRQQRHDDRRALAGRAATGRRCASTRPATG